ncbi:85/88 kDa calcium-independent phospholipase A2 [Toxocara canis]|uniref:85/88 kDa calcium-independent phospholipase A2 n=1 Tax=Toxocara canis TaxID=6265 RepID=A0A0B2V0B3_TOXCA|nr:85/88 kDa calcium-independent phospholipase A2 [Toxocara canis]
MPSGKCAHMLSANKKFERIHNLIQFAKSATRNQLTSKLIDCWSQPQSSITEATDSFKFCFVRILLTLGAEPDALYEDEYGRKELDDRIANGNVCVVCAEKYNDFLAYAQLIHEAQFEQAPILIPRHRRCKTGLIALSLDGGGMRGLVSVVCLMFASRRLFGDEYLPNVVDWMIGTSTGSMLGLSLAKGLTLTEAFFLYWDMKDEIFLDGSTMKRLFGSMVDRQSRNMDDVLQKCFPDQYTFLRSSLLAVELKPPDRLAHTPRYDVVIMLLQIPVYQSMKY